MKPISSLNPVFYRLSVFLRRIQRTLIWYFSRVHFAKKFPSEILTFTVISHNSLLRRKLAGTDVELQINKVESLKIASELVDGVIIKPGELFSFWKLVGKPTSARGFPLGLQLSFGNLTSMVGGGLCQLTNLLHWMVLQTPLAVTERHRHATDPFPDYKRKVPFGSGATVFYNYLDFAFRNDTSSVFQVKVRVEEEYLCGEIRCEKALPYRYSIVERNHRFLRKNGTVFRENELWCRKSDAESSIVLSESLLFKNHAEVLYHVAEMTDVEFKE